MQERTHQQEARFKQIIREKIDPPEGQKQDCDFRQYVFLGRAMFIGAVFRGNADFTNATFGGDARFDGAVFGMYAFFGGTTFKQEGSFQGATFVGPAFFLRAAFIGLALFDGGTTFAGDAIFGGATFSGGAKFNDATFRWEARFSGATSPNSCVLQAEEVTIRHGRGASLYRLAKQSHQDYGEYRRAGDYHYWERVHSLYERSRLPRWFLRFAAVLHSQMRAWLRGRRFRVWDKPTAWRLLVRRLLRRCLQPQTLRMASVSLRSGLANCVEFVVGRVVFGYGEKLWRPLISAAVVIGVCAGLYSLTGIKGTGDTQISNGLDYVYFSLVTFAALGYGDMRPASASSRIIANAESLIGLLLVAAFAVCLAKRYARG